MSTMYASAGLLVQERCKRRLPSDLLYVSARAARVHLGEALNRGEDILELLDADSSELDALYAVFFDSEQNDLREEYRQGAGGDLFYIDGIRLDAGWEGKNIELAVADRLASTLESGFLFIAQWEYVARQNGGPCATVRHAVSIEPFKSTKLR